MALLACAVTAIAWPTPSSGAARSCQRPGDRQLAVNERASVLVNTSGRALACDRRTGRRVRLEETGSRAELVALNHVWLRGPFVLFEVFGSDATNDDVSLRLRDVRRNGQQVTNLVSTTGTIGPNGLVLDAVVDEAGNLAAILDATDIGSPTFAARRVIVCPYRGCGDGGGDQPMVVDQNANIRGTSLTRRGRSVTWTSGDKRRRVAFP